MTPSGRRHAGLWAGWLAALLTLGVGGVALWRLHASLDVSYATGRLERSLSLLSDIVSQMKDAETGQRGYILTGDTSYLQPYRSANRATQADLDSLRHIDFPALHTGATAAALVPLIARRMREIDTTIALRASAGFGPAVNVVRTNAGKRSMDTLRAAVAAMSRANARLLDGERERLSASVRVAVITIAGGTLAVFALAILAQVSVQRATTRLKRFAAELAVANRELEVKTHAADAASRAKSDFLAVMSHELRTPLNAILGYASLMSDCSTGPVTSAQANALGRIQFASRTLASLIDEILTYAGVGRGTETLTLTTVDLAACVDDVVGLAENIFDAKGLALVVDTKGDWPVVRTDARKVTHILLNLLTNAAKFTPSGTVRIAARTEDHRAVIDVIDPGIGIRPEDLDRIFEAFVQVDSRRAREAEGAGLGLATARRLARLLGGDLTVRSDVKRGSTFSLSLPGVA